MTSINERLSAMQKAAIPARHVSERPLTKNPNGPKHKHVSWDVTAAALNYYLTPAGWALQMGIPMVERTGPESAIVIVTATLNVMTENGEIVASRSASGSADASEIDAAGQATAAAFKRAATMMGYSLVTGAVCNCKEE